MTALPRISLNRAYENARYLEVLASGSAKKAAAMLKGRAA
jgi:hypothetical protein